MQITPNVVIKAHISTQLPSADKLQRHMRGIPCSTARQRGSNAYGDPRREPPAVRLL